MKRTELDVQKIGYGVKIEASKRLKRRIYNRYFQHKIAEMFARKRGSN